LRGDDNVWIEDANSKLYVGVIVESTTFSEEIKITVTIKCFDQDTL